MTRYNVVRGISTPAGCYNMSEDKDGLYVLYADVQTELDRLRQLNAARKDLVKMLGVSYAAIRHSNLTIEELQKIAEEVDELRAKIAGLEGE